MEYSLLIAYIGEFNDVLHKAVEQGWQPLDSHTVTIESEYKTLVTQMMCKAKED